MLKNVNSDTDILYELHAYLKWNELDKYYGSKLEDTIPTKAKLEKFLKIRKNGLSEITKNLWYMFLNLIISKYYSNLKPLIQNPRSGMVKMCLNLKNTN